MRKWKSQSEREWWSLCKILTTRLEMTNESHFDWLKHIVLINIYRISFGSSFVQIQFHSNPNEKPVPPSGNVLNVGKRNTRWFFLSFICHLSNETTFGVQLCGTYKLSKVVFGQTEWFFCVTLLHLIKERKLCEQCSTHTLWFNCWISIWNS